jgi:VWFA-related protein
MRRYSIQLIAWFCVFSGLGQMSAQQPVDQRGAVRESVHVNVVNVEVHVSDRDGRPVRGLPAAQFELRVDGKVVPLTNFYEATETRSALTPAGAGDQAPQQTPQQTLGEASPPAIDKPVNVVIVVDSVNLKTIGRRMLVEGLYNLVNTWPRAQDPMTVLAFGTSLRHFCGPTTSRDEVLAALGRVIGKASDGSFLRKDGSGEADLDRRRYAPPTSSVGPQADWAQGDLSQDQRDRELFEVALVQSLVGVVGAMAELPGRSKLLYVSDGIPRDLPLIRFKLTELLERSNAGHVSIYPISARTVYGPSGLDLNRRGLFNTSTSVHMASSQEQMLYLERSMADLAEQTGGRKLYTEPTLERAFATFTEDLSSYYSLGFVPDFPGSGKLHAIEVRVGGKDLTLRYRRSFYDRGTQDRRYDQVTAGMLFGGNTDALQLRVDVGAATPAGKGLFDVPIEVRVATKSIALVPENGFYSGNVTISIGARDDKGGTARPEPRSFPIHMSEAEYRAVEGRDLVFTFTLKLKPTRQTLVVTANDEISRLNAVATAPIEPGVPE